jgi:hypothetical protein
MKSYLTVRNMCEPDLDAVLSLDDWPPSARLSRAYLEGMLASDAAQCVVAVRHDQIAGFYVAWRILSGVELARICVSKGRDAKQVLRAVLRGLVCTLRGPRPNAVFITVPETNHMLRRGLSWFGFLRTGQVGAPYGAGEVGGKHYVLPSTVMDV